MRTRFFLLLTVFFLTTACALRTQAPPGSGCKVTAEKCDHCEIECHQTKGDSAEGTVGEVPAP